MPAMNGKNSPKIYQPAFGYPLRYFDEKKIISKQLTRASKATKMTSAPGIV